MGSVGNQNPFAPYDNYRDCSQGICSIYCPQFCYLIFPPPPPTSDDSGPSFSPLIIAIIVVLACAFVLASYYTFATRYSRSRDRSTGVEAGESNDESGQGQYGSSGLDEALIKRITVCKYQKGDGLIEGTECAVCLSEFQENESLRLMPKCSHAFHLPCIDTWLKSQANCPLCRANVEALAHLSPPPVPGAQASPVFNMNPYESQGPDDLVLVVDGQERNCDEHVVVVGRNAEASAVRNENTETNQGTAEQLRSVSLGTFSPQRQLLISDILKFEDIDEYIKMENDHLWRGTGSSSGNRSRDGELLRSPVATKKFIPNGRFLFSIHDKGKNSILPN